MAGVTNETSQPLKTTQFRLTERDIEILDEARRRGGLATRTEALRFILRQFDDFTKAADKKQRDR